MRKVIIGIATVAAIAATACDDREDVFVLRNKKPELIINYAGRLDSLKVGNERELSIEVRDEGELSVEYANLEGGLNIIPSTQSGKVKVIAKTPGKQTISLYGVDCYGLSVEEKITTEVFENLPPVCNFSIEIAGTKEIDVDARSSFDKDNAFGGKIILYEYDLNGYKFETTLPRIRHIFSETGQKRIRVRVKDSDSVYSEFREEYITI